MLENLSLDDALVTAAPFGPILELLLAEYAGGWMSEVFSQGSAERLLKEAKARANYVIVDSPPLTAVVDTIPLARRVDDVLIVSRIGVTRLDNLRKLAEFLASNGITPVGFALVGTGRPDAGYYYHEEEEKSFGEVRLGTATERVLAPVRRRRRSTERTG